MSEEIVRYVNAACEGNTAAMGPLYTKTLRASYYLALKLSNDADASKEIAKKAYSRAFCTIKKLKKPEAFEIWMKQNIASVYKESQNFTFTDATADANESSMEFLSEAIIVDEAKSAEILSAVSALSNEVRTAIVLHYYCGMPVASLSKFLGVSESTVNAILADGKNTIVSACQCDEPKEALPGVLPVLTRLFQAEAAAVVIDNGAVRDIFSSAMEIYKSFVAAETEKAAAPSVPKPGYFTANANDDGLDIPKKPTGTNAPHATADEVGVDFDRFVDEEPVRRASAPKENKVLETINGLLGKIGIKKLNVKVVIAFVVALLIVIVGISAIVSAVKNKSSDNEVQAQTETVVSAEDTTYIWKAGGFEECKTIEYLDEYACVFKSATTGKYGLLDYQGNVILEPNYESFERCGSGRDYSSRSSYHTLVKIGNDEYELTYGNGAVTVSSTPHSAHGIITDTIDSKSYDERDRYFNGYAAARKNGKWGYVSQDKDKKVIPYEYDAVNDLQAGEAAMCDYCRFVTSDGLIPVKKDGKMGIINLDNDIIVPFEYDNILPGLNGVFIAQKDGTWGVILTGSAVSTFTGVNVVVGETLDPEYVDEDEPVRYFVVADDGANIRTEADASKDSNVVAVLASGEEVDGYGTKTAENGKDWLIIKYNDSFAYISMSVLQKVED